MGPSMPAVVHYALREGGVELREVPVPAPTEGDVLVFDVTLSNPSAETIVVSLNTADGTAAEGTDFTSIDGQLVTFLAGQTSATVTVSSTGDEAFEGDETFTVSATGVSGSVSTGDTGVGTIVEDDEAPTLLIGDATATEGDALVFGVTLSNPSAETIVVSLETAGGTADERGPAGSITDSRVGRLPLSRSLISSPVRVSNSSRPLASVSRFSRFSVRMRRASACPSSTRRRTSASMVCAVASDTFCWRATDMPRNTSSWFSP